MNDKDIDQQIKDLLKSVKNNDEQLTFDFDDNMNGYQAQPALTISSLPTISISGLDCNDTISLSGNYTYGPSITNQYTYSNTSYGGTTIANYPPTIIPTIITNGTSGYDFSNVSQAGLYVRGDAEFEGDVKVKGKSLNQTLEKIEEKLAILHPNTELEEKWEELRDLRNQYIKLEKEIKEKEKMWDILKK